MNRKRTFTVFFPNPNGSKYLWLMFWDFGLWPEDLTWETGSAQVMEVTSRFISAHFSCKESLQHWHFHNRRERKKKEDVFNPSDCCWFSNNKHESVSLIILYTANICVMCLLSTCAVRTSHWSVSASTTNIWKCGFVWVFACLHEQEREQELNSQNP